MNCPEPIARVVLELLYRAMLIIRMAGGDGDARRCALEADHVHNLPHLLADFDEKNLRHYWDVERQVYLRSCERMGREAPQEYRRLWDELRRHWS